MLGLGAAKPALPVSLLDSWSLSGNLQSKREAGAIPIDWIVVANGGGVAIDVTGASAIADAVDASDYIAITATLQFR